MAVLIFLNNPKAFLLIFFFCTNCWMAKTVSYHKRNTKEGVLIGFWWGRARKSLSLQAFLFLRSGTVYNSHVVHKYRVMYASTLTIHTLFSDTRMSYMLQLTFNSLLLLALLTNFLKRDLARSLRGISEMIRCLRILEPSGAPGQWTTWTPYC